MYSVDRNADRGARRPLHGRVVLITGAGTGIGRATALMAGRQGAALVLVGRRHAPLDSVAAAAAEAGARCLVLPGDICAASFAAHAVAATLDRFGGLDGLVNNAAIASFGALSETSDADVRSMFEVNLLAPLRFVREAVAALKRRGGAVVNVSSIGGVVATPGRAPYGALKAALNHMTRSLARELAPDVRVNAVLPGLVSTPMHERLNVSAEQAASLLAEMVRTTPAGRMGQAEEIARWICRLLEAESAWVTGSLFTLDGGRSA